MPPLNEYLCMVVFCCCLFENPRSKMRLWCPYCRQKEREGRRVDMSSAWLIYVLLVSRRPREAGLWLCVPWEWPFLKDRNEDALSPCPSHTSVGEHSKEEHGRAESVPQKAKDTPKETVNGSTLIFDKRYTNAKSGDQGCSWVGRMLAYCAWRLSWSAALCRPDTAVHTCNFSTWEKESVGIGGIRSSRSFLDT